LSDIKEDLAFANRLRGNPTKVGGEDCVSTGGIKRCGTSNSMPLMQNKGKHAQIRRRL